MLTSQAGVEGTRRRSKVGGLGGGRRGAERWPGVCCAVCAEGVLFARSFHGLGNCSQILSATMAQRALSETRKSHHCQGFAFVKVSGQVEKLKKKAESQSRARRMKGHIHIRAVYKTHLDIKLDKHLSEPHGESRNSGKHWLNTLRRAGDGLDHRRAPRPKPRL